jgi:hypothetical protein
MLSAPDAPSQGHAVTRASCNRFAVLRVAIVALNEEQLRHDPLIEAQARARKERREGQGALENARTPV